MRHLRYYLPDADMYGIWDHPQIAMKKIGITYESAVPQSIGDQWWFLNCEGYVVLPPYLEEFELTQERYEHWVRVGFKMPED